jgi:hypothetical protein
LRLHHGPQPVPAAFDDSGKLAKSRERGKARMQRSLFVLSRLPRRTRLALLFVGARLFGGDSQRRGWRSILAQTSGRGRGNQARSARIGPGRIRMEMLGKQVDEAAHFRGKMVAMGVNRVDGMLGLQKLGQDRNQTTGLDFVAEQKARRQRQALAVDGGEP